MRARISIRGGDILCQAEGAEPGDDVRLPLNDATLRAMAEWSERYRLAVRLGDQDALPGLGTAVLDWLDQGQWASRWLRGVGDRLLEVAADDVNSTAAAALLDLPWELLARGGDFLAADPTQLFVVFRGLARGANATPARPAYRDLTLMFMAASPAGQRELDFEAEEAAILEATARLPLRLVVEESGCGAFLKDRLALEGPFEAVHLSCHGDIRPNGDPVLALESPEGELAFAEPGDLAAILGEEKAPLVFLSACRTAEAKAGEAAAMNESYVRAMVRAGVANAVGWDGSVVDSDAILFAETFYRELAEQATVPYAAARARLESLRRHREDPSRGRHWHLARVYAGPQGAGPLCDRAKPKRGLRKDTGFKEFLDKARHRVPVATARVFVGRRRQAQAVLRAFREGRAAGVLLLGLGDQGKSSLAARIANRLPSHQAVVVYERYDPLALFDQLVDALPGSEREEWNRRWRRPIAERGAQLGAALEDLLEGPFDDNPILLIIDDLEQILEPPAPDALASAVREAPGAAEAWRDSLAAVLRAFQAADTDSRLLLTSRFPFRLPDGRGGDLADRLVSVPLRAMETEEREKQWRAAARAAGRSLPRPDEAEAALVARALAAAGGNPGLQEILCRPLLGGEAEVARAAIDAMERWRASGEVPAEGNAAAEFFLRVCFRTYQEALSPSQRAQLRAATLFSEGLPIPIGALEGVGRGLGVEDPPAAVARLLSLGLVEAWGPLRGVAHAAANPLARSLPGEGLAPEEEKRLAAAAVGPLAKAWQTMAGDFPPDAQAVEAARLALIGGATVEVVESAAVAAGRFLFGGLHEAKAALAILEPARLRLEEQGSPATPRLLHLASNCAERLGETALRMSLLEKGLALKDGDRVELARLAAEHAVATIGRDGPELALARLRQAATCFAEEGDVRSRAVTMGKIADVLQQRGESDEALRIHLDERLPVAVAMKDIDSIAHIRLCCAQLRLQRGGLDQGEGQAIVGELSESFKLYLKLRRADGIAMAGWLLGQILAAIHHADEALMVLEAAAAAFEQLKHEDGVRRVRELRRSLENREREG
ncbi:MAG: CHAT domain-containing protein [Cyanobacteriota bacterium]|nr:CHAT domain-containing protein [Cyanobacteriota bacterium]